MNFKKYLSRKNFVKLAYVVVGATVGYAYYYFIGCTSGTCPISSNPYLSILYGGVFGFTLALIKED
ncbi:MAG: DUF6132 family protein [Candidatus Kryptoniota bacterium]